MYSFRPPALDKAAPIVDPVTGRITPYFQRFWQNLSFTAGDAAETSNGAVQRSTFATWSAPTGTTSRTTFATYTAPSASATYNQAQLQAAMDHIQVLSRRVAALIDDLTS